MPDYLLPCTCGQKTPVSAAQAGETIRCGCGAELHVPTLRGLRALETAGTTPATQRGAWEDRHRAAFVLVVGALACLAVAAYLWITMPPGPIRITPDEAAAAVQGASLTQAMEAYAQMQQGLEKPASAEDDSLEQTRHLMFWGGAVAAAVAVGQIGAAAVVLRRRS